MADIGEKLSSARKAKGMSISDVERITKIQSRYLTAIEEDDYDKLPGDFYVRAFIRQYANVVGLDGKKLLESYHKDVPEAKPDEYVENSIDNKSEEVKKTTENKKGLWQAYLPKVLGIIGALVVFMLIYLVFSRMFGGSNRGAANNANNVTVSETGKKKPKRVATPVTSGVRISKVEPGVYRVRGLKSNRKLVVSADSATYTQISEDSNYTWANNLDEGQKHTADLPAGTKRVTVTFNNGAGASIRIGGKRVPFTRAAGRLQITLLIGSAKNTSSNNQSQSYTGYSSNQTTGQTGQTETNSNTQQTQTQRSNTGQTTTGKSQTTG
ncbi:MAG: helix-turn-helix domain-containing protein, partial [Lactobacillus sp.]